jgi:hypothetical protein
MKKILFFFLAMLLSATMSPGLALDGSGDRFDRGSRYFDDSLGYSDDEYVSRGRARMWDMRFLTDVAMEHPRTFSIVNTDGKRLRLETARGEYSTTAYKKVSRATEDPVTWFIVFKEFLITNFHPKVRGAAGFRARLTNGRLERINFYGCRANIPYKRGAGQIAPNSKDFRKSVLKATITDAIKSTLAEAPMRFPAGVKSFDVDLIMGGDPVSDGGCWFGMHLISSRYHRNEKLQPSSKQVVTPQQMLEPDELN